MSEFYVYAENGDRIGLLQDIESVQWLEYYQRVGEAKIVARGTPENIALMKANNRIYNTDSSCSMWVKEADIEEVEGDRNMIVRAVTTAQILDDRVMMGTMHATNAEAAIYSPLISNRRGLTFELAIREFYPELLDKQISWGTCLEAMTEVAEASGLGFAFDFNPYTAVETLRVYKGVDRSDPLREGYVGYFGDDADNVNHIRIITGISNYKNVAVVAGEGEGSNRVIRIVSTGDFSGIYRHEIFVDARDLQSKTQVAIDTGKLDAMGNPVYEYQEKNYTPKEYAALLEDRGLRKLSEHLKTLEITCEIDQSTLVLGRDYHLGDRLPVKLPEYGIYASAQVSATTRIYELGGRKVTASLNNFILEDYQNAVFPA